MTATRDSMMTHTSDVSSRSKIKREHSLYFQIRKIINRDLWGGHEGHVQVIGSVLFLDLGAEYMGLLSKILASCTLMIYTFFPEFAALI